ncbi:hypothetical protein DTO271G3_8017 [Paecilomyces variotii]|nr:hypothetical protein DTO271G3_8017 [Paecilomyces variotii]
MRFSRLKKQIEQGSMNEDFKAEPQKNGAFRAKKPEETGEADNNPTLDSGAELPVTKVSTRPGNDKLNLKDCFDYGIPPEADKYARYESDGSLYKAECADVETDEDIPLAKRTKMTRKLGKQKTKEQPVIQHVARDEGCQERARTSLDLRGCQGGVMIELLSDGEDQALRRKKHALASPGTQSASDGSMQAISKGQQQTSNEGADAPLEIGRRNETVTSTSTTISRIPYITQAGVSHHRQHNDGYTAYPSSRPFPSSFRLQRTKDAPRGPATTYSFGPEAIENNCIDPIIRPPFFRSHRATPGISHRGQRPISQRGMADHAETMQEVQAQSKPAEIGRKETTTDQTAAGCNTSETDQLATGASTESQEPSQQTRPQMPQIVIDLEGDPE